MSQLQYTDLVEGIKNTADITVVTHLLDQGADVNLVETPGYSPLTAAIRCEADRRILMLLLGRGADVNAVDGHLCSPLTAAMECKADLSTVELLLDWQAAVNQVDGRGRCPLTAAMEYKADISVVMLLLKHGAKVNHVKCYGYSPLVASVRSHADLGMVTLLLDHGADVNHICHRSYSPLTAAIRCQADISVVTLLLDRGANVNLVDTHGYSPLTTAMLKKVDISVVMLLLDHGADLNHIEGHGHSPLTTAIWRKADINVISLLLDNGADVDQEDYRGQRPLDFAIEQELGVDIYILLFQHSINTPETSRYLLLQEVLKSRDVRYIHAIVDAGFDVHHKFQSGLSRKSAVEMVAPTAWDHISRSMLAALHTRPPAKSLMSREEWYRRSFYNERDLIRLIVEQPKLEHLEDKEYTYLPVQKVPRSSIEEHFLNREEVYKMTSRPRGRALLINIREFDKICMTRRGSEHDVRRLDKLFRQLGFDVEVLDKTEQCTQKNIREKLEVEKTHAVHKKADAFVLVIMSHGNLSGILKTSDEKDLSIKEDIVRPLDGDHWPLMQGKPKLFFIQACRGGGQAYGYDSVDAAPATERTAGPNELHPKVDIVKIFSTYEGFSAVRVGGDERDPAAMKGAWFIREFVLVCELFAHKDHLVDLVAKANLLLQRRKTSLSYTIQTAQVDSSLRRKLFFFPGYYDDEQEAKRCSMMLTGCHSSLHSVRISDGIRVCCHSAHV